MRPIPAELAKRFIRLTAHGSFPLDHLSWLATRALASSTADDQSTRLVTFPIFSLAITNATVPECKQYMLRPALLELPIARCCPTKTAQMSYG
jgi:hypothetical protein